MEHDIFVGCPLVAIKQRRNIIVNLCVIKGNVQSILQINTRAKNGDRLLLLKQSTSFLRKQNELFYRVEWPIPIILSCRVTKLPRVFWFYTAVGLWFRELLPVFSAT